MLATKGAFYRICPPENLGLAELVLMVGSGERACVS